MSVVDVLRQKPMVEYIPEAIKRKVIEIPLCASTWWRQQKP